MRPTLALLSLALVLALAAGAARARRLVPAFAFQVELTTDTPGRAQVYYDLGRSLNESDSTSQAVSPANGRATLVFPLPQGEYHGLRFDPINGPATVTFLHARIVAPGGGVIRELAPRDFAPNDNIEAYASDGPATIVRVAAGRDDPNLSTAFSPPLVLQFDWPARLRAVRGATVAYFFEWLVVLLALAGGWQNRAGLMAWARRRPKSALSLVAVAAGITASYPVVFFGRSFVAPNTTALLHQSPPTVPGCTDREATDLHAADPAVIMWQNIPYSVAEHHAILGQHEWPLWDRFVSCGVTLIGQGQSMLGDPVHLLVVATRGASWAWDVKFVLAKILFAAGVAFTVWAFTADLAAAAIIAIGAPFIAFYNFRFNHPAIFSLSYAPWILCAWALITRAVDVRQLRGPFVLLILANFSVLGSGTVKEAYALVLALNLSGAAWWLLTPAPVGVGKRTRAILIALAALCAVAVSAPLWLPFFEALRTSTTSYEQPVVWQAPRAWLVGLFDSLFYVELNPAHRGFQPAANFLLLLGAVFAVFQSPRRLRQTPHVIVLWLALLCAVLLAFEFVPARWIAATPFLRNLYHVHNTFTVVAVVLLAVTAGCGFHFARIRLAEPGPWRPLALAGSVLAILLAVYFHDLPGTWLTGPGLAGWWRRVPEHAFFYANLILMLVACVTLVSLARRRLLGHRTSGAAAIVAGAALVVLLYRHGLHVDVGIGRTYLTFPMARADLAVPSRAIDAARLDAGREPFRMIGTDANLINGWNTVYGVESVNGPDAIMNRPYREFAETAGLVPKTDWRFVVSPGDLRRHRPFLDFLGVRYVVSNVSQLPADSGYTKVGSFDLDVYRSNTAWPRAFFADRVEPYHTAQDLVTRIGSDAGPFAAIQDPDRTALPANLLQSTRGAQIVAARDYRLTANGTRFTIDAPGPGVAVLQETWSPNDFRVTLNGRRVGYFRVNHAFKAVAIPRAGEYRVIMTYWPEHFTAALWVGAAGLAGIGLLLLGLGRIGRARAAAL